MNAIFTTDDRVAGLTKSTAARKDVLPIARTEPAASRLCQDAPLSRTGAETSSANNRVGDEAVSRELKASNQAGTQARPVDTHSARLSELAAMLAEDPGNAELLGRRDAHKPMANPDPCDWEAGLPLRGQSDRVQEYLRGYEAELKHEREVA